MQSLAERAQSLERLLEALYDRAIVQDGCFWCGCLARLSAAFDAQFAYAAGAGERLRALHSFSAADAPGPAHNDDCPERFAPGSGCRQIICPVLGPASAPALIGLCRAEQDPEFTAGQAEMLMSLSRHLGRMAQIRDAVVGERARHDQVAGMLERLPIPLVLVNCSGRVLYLNQMAGELLRRGDGLALRPDGTISADAGQGGGELRRALARFAVMRGEPPRDAFATAHVTIGRRGSPLPLVCAITRADGAGFGVADPVLAIIITDPRKSAGREWGDFAAAYRLTKAEARLVALLADGLGLFEAAERLGISRNTARTHMRSIHSKVGTSRQTDLIRLLERFNPFQPASGLSPLVPAA